MLLKRGVFLLLFFGLLTVATWSAENPKILMKTELGDILIEVYPDKAPVTVANFLRYVDEGRFEGALFFRAVTMDNQPNMEIKIEIIQGGLSRAANARPLPPIEHETTDETGILHKDGTISMARLMPGSASSDFFICVGDQPSLDFGGMRNRDGQGFAAFGMVIEGMDVVRKIQQQPSERQYLTTPIKIFSIKRAGAGR
jgi:peptidyl-prolyl cis-trans isomerase A (cyclophilin A)